MPQPVSRAVGGNAPQPREQGHRGMWSAYCAEVFFCRTLWYTFGRRRNDSGVVCAEERTDREKHWLCTGASQSALMADES